MASSKEWERKKFSFAILSYCVERVRKFKYIYIYTRREKIYREVIQFSSNGYFKNAHFREGRRREKKKYESSSTKSYTLHEFLAKIWLPCLLLQTLFLSFFFFPFRLHS